MLDDCLSRLNMCAVKVFLPRFRVDLDSVDIAAHLGRLGMSLAFTRFAADFSGINGQAPPRVESLFLSAVFHKAFVKVTEEGTEAAAATALTMVARSAMNPPKPPPVPVFQADHPFVFAIRERRSRAILFLGRLVDPTHA